MSDSVRPHRWQPTRLPRPWDSPGKNTGVGCHFLLQCMKVKSKREVAQSCPTLSDPMDCSPPGSSIHGIFQARVLEWVPLPSPSLIATQFQMKWIHYISLIQPWRTDTNTLLPKDQWYKNGIPIKTSFWPSVTIWMYTENAIFRSQDTYTYF